MRAVVVYESMYGNTRLIAHAIAKGMARTSDVEVDVVPVGQAGPELLEGAGLVVVGGPTHVHGMSRPATRKQAEAVAAKDGNGLRLEPDAQKLGVREWLTSISRIEAGAAAFDTRLDGPPLFTGRASKQINAMLRRRGCTIVTAPESFLVTGDNQLCPDEQERATIWGQSLIAAQLAGLQV